MTAIPDPISAFAYRAQTAAGESLSGTIDAANVDDANRRLTGLQLHVLRLEPIVVAAGPPRTKPLRGDDFLAFNTQLAHLTTAGLPVEQGLRLIAEDMRSRRMSQTVRQIAGELETGQPLADAFEKHAANFPPLYGQLIRAGVRTGNLPAMLLNLGRHVELITRLRAALWRAASYPIMVLVSLVLVMAFLCIYVFPRFELIFRDFRIQLPLITRLVLGVGGLVADNAVIIVVLLVLLIVGAPLVWQVFRRFKWDQPIIETLIFPLPLLGPALRRNTLARWCDALRLGVEAGLDLPAAIDLAVDAVGSPRLRADSSRIIDALRGGQPLDHVQHLRFVPQSVVSVLALAVDNDALPSGLDTLSRMIQQQAEIRTALIPAILTPLLIISIATMIAIVVLAMFAPIIALIQAVSSPGKW
jgi:type II secretory pathway component PulF